MNGISQAPVAKRSYTVALGACPSEWQRQSILDISKMKLESDRHRPKRQDQNLRKSLLIFQTLQSLEQEELPCIPKRPIARVRRKDRRAKHRVTKNVLTLTPSVLGGHVDDDVELKEEDGEEDTPLKLYDTQSATLLEDSESDRNCVSMRDSTGYCNLLCSPAAEQSISEQSLSSSPLLTDLDADLSPQTLVASVEASDLDSGALSRSLSDVSLNNYADHRDNDTLTDLKDLAALSGCDFAALRDAPTQNGNTDKVTAVVGADFSQYDLREPVKLYSRSTSESSDVDCSDLGLDSADRTFADSDRTLVAAITHDVSLGVSAKSFLTLGASDLSPADKAGGLTLAQLYPAAAAAAAESSTLKGSCGKQEGTAACYSEDGVDNIVQLLVGI